MTGVIQRQWLGIGVPDRMVQPIGLLELLDGDRRSRSVSGMRLDSTIAMVPVGSRRKSSSERPKRFGTSSTAIDRSGAVAAGFQMPYTEIEWQLVHPVCTNHAPP